MHAEDAYLFRHALLRDAAYGLLPPAQRAELHSWSAAIIEGLVGSVVPARPTKSDFHPEYGHPAAELAEHFRLGNPDRESSHMLAKELHYSMEAARDAEFRFARGESLRLWVRAAEIAGDEVRCDCLASAANNAVELGQTTYAETLYLEALSYGRTVPSPASERRLLCALGMLYSRIGQTDEAEENYLAALEFSESAGDASLAGVVENSLGLLYTSKGRYADAERHYRLALEGGAKHGTPIEVASTCQNYGLLLLRTERLEEARSYLDRAYGIALNAENRQMVAQIECNRGVLLLELGDNQAGQAAFQSALNTLMQTGDLRFAGIAEANLATIHLKAGHTAMAEQGFRRALSVLRESGAIRYEASVHSNYATLLRSQGRQDEAVQHCGDAIFLASSCADRERQGIAKCILALCELELGKHSMAATTWSSGVSHLLEFAQSATSSKLVASMRDACAKAGIEPFNVPNEDQDARAHFDE